MPPRPVKKSPAKKPSAKTIKQSPTADSFPAEALPSVPEESVPPTEEKPSEVDAVSDDTLAEIDALLSSASVKEEIIAKDAEKIVEPEVPADPIVEDSNNQLESEDISEDKEAELDDKGPQSESEEPLEGEGDDVHEETGDAVAGFEVDEDNADGVDDKDDGANDVDVDDEENEDNEDTLSVQVALAEGRKQKESVIFVGGLDKEAVEDDLLAVFGVFGDVQCARIVRHPTTKKSKGFAFIHFADSENAKKALADLKDGTEIKGKRVRIQASQDNGTLYLGNICKTWTKDNVIEKLKNLGVEQIDNILLPVDPKNGEKIKGFAFLEFNSHSDAIVAFQRLRKPDADFGRDRTAKVAFSNTLHHNEDIMLQVKTVYVEGIPLSWDEEKVKEISKEYGQIEKVQLSRNFNSSKRKDFGFVEFSSRESALACVEGINKAQIVEGDSKILANIARPWSKSRVAKQGTKGGFKAKKDGETVQESARIEKKRKSKSVEKKPITKNAKRNNPSTSQIIRGKSGTETTPIKRKKASGNEIDTDASHPPSKKMRQNHSNGKAYGKRFDGGNRSTIRKGRFDARATGFPANRYHGYSYAEASEPQPHPSDLVPHAGYIPAIKQVTSNYEYGRRRSGPYNNDIRGSFGSSRALSGIPPSYYPDAADYYYQLAGQSHRSSGGYAPRGPPYY